MAWHIFFTLLMFRKPNKTTINKIKRQIFIGRRPFDSRLYLHISRSFKWKEPFIFRYCKVFQVSQVFTCGLSDLLLLAVGSLVVFVLPALQTVWPPSRGFQRNENPHHWTELSVEWFSTWKLGKILHKRTPCFTSGRY
jgi:hypothetical protein